MSGSATVMLTLSVRERIETFLGRVVLSIPDRVLWKLSIATERDGRVLDAQSQFALALAPLTGVQNNEDLPLEQARRSTSLSGQRLGPLVTGVTTLEVSLGGIGGRLYEPAVRRSPVCGAVVFFHGGGFVVGDLDSHDRACRALCARLRVPVIAVDYRRAPETPFPGAIDDALAATRHVFTRCDEWKLDPTRMAVAGDSAGGNLAALVSLETRRDAIRPCFQLLIYPVTDMTMSSASIKTFATGFYLEATTIAWYRDRYLQGADPRHPRASPLHVSDLSGAPPALVLVAGFDPLRDEGLAYAQKLQAAGVEVIVEEASGLFHGFWNTTGVVRAAAAAFDKACMVLEHKL